MKRLLEDEGSGLGRAVLRSARLDTPGRGAKERALMAAGTIAATTIAAGAEAGAAGLASASAGVGAGGGATAAAGSMAFFKWIGAVSIVGLGAMGLAIQSERAAPRESSTAITTQTTEIAAPPLASALAPVTPPPLATQKEDPVAPVLVPTPPVVPSAVIKPAPSASAPPSAAASASESPLNSEFAALDDARAAVASGQPRRAIALLDAYAQRFPRGLLALEATMLRIEALHKSGDRAGAAAIADRFLASYPNSPYAARVRSLIGVK